MLSLPASALAGFRRALATGRSGEEAALASREVGFETGEAYYAALRSWAATDGDLGEAPADEFWARLRDFFAGNGWGPLEFEELHAGVAALSSRDWAEAGVTRGARQPSCHFTTGMLADLLGRLTEGEVAVLEVECRSRGDERCRVLIGGSEALGQVYEALQEGTPLSDVLHRLG